MSISVASSLLVYYLVIKSRLVSWPRRSNLGKDKGCIEHCSRPWKKASTCET